MVARGLWRGARHEPLHLRPHPAGRGDVPAEHPAQAALREEAGFIQVVEPPAKVLERTLHERGAGARDAVGGGLGAAAGDGELDGVLRVGARAGVGAGVGAGGCGRVWARRQRERMVDGGDGR